MLYINSQSTQSLAGLQLQRHFQSGRQVSRQDLAALVKDDKAALGVRLAAKVALESFEALDARAGQPDGKVDQADFSAMQSGQTVALPPSLAAAAMVGDVLLKNFASVNTSARDWTSAGLLDITELEGVSTANDELRLAAAAGREIFEVLETAASGGQQDGRIGMGDLRAVIDLGVRALKGDVADAVRGAFVRIGQAHGDPAYGHIDVRLDWNDARLRDVDPSFNGLESVSVDIPGFGRFQLQHRQIDGVDVYTGGTTYRLGQEEAVLRNGVTFSVSTNVGTFENIAKGKRVNDPLT